MIPSQDYFIHKMKELDIRIDDLIVVYDKTGMTSAPRAFWMFKAFGAPNVSILNGSFFKWEHEKRQIASGDTPDAWKKIRDDKHKF